MRGESAGQKEILQNYGTVENGEKKKKKKKQVEIEKECRGKLERCVILAPCCLTAADLN